MRDNVMFANFKDAENIRIWKNIIFCYTGKMGKQAETSGFQEQILNFMRNNVMFANSENIRIWKNIIFSYAGKMGKQAENSGFQERISSAPKLYA